MGAMGILLFDIFFVVFFAICFLPFDGSELLHKSELFEPKSTLKKNLLITQAIKLGWILPVQNYR